MKFSPSHSVCGSPGAMCGLWGGECGGDCRRGVKCGVGGQKEGGGCGGMGAIRRAPVVQGVQRGQWVTQQEDGCKKRKHIDG